MVGSASSKRVATTTLLSLFLFLSGIASITYQVTWVRLLGLSMGATSASISTVIAAFFFGLAAGSYFAERLLRGRGNALSVYAALEAAIAVAGLLSLPVLLNLDGVLAQVPMLGDSLAVKFFVALLLLSVPTFCMGATFPVVAAIAIRQHAQLGRHLSHLYSVNTAGAVLGALLSGFVFIPLVGLDGAIYSACMLNLTVAVTAAWLCQRGGHVAVIRSPEPNRAVPAGSAPPAFGATRFAEAAQEVPPAVNTGIAAGAALAVTGMAAIATEVGWTKYLSIFTGTTIYGFAAILGIFLGGIAAGAWLVRDRLDRLRAPVGWMSAGLLLLGTTLLLTRAGLGLVPDVYAAINQIDFPDPVIHGLKYTFVLLLLLLPTLLFGALFPLTMKLYCVDAGGARTGVGRGYALNTLAGIAGAVLAGFWIIPVYGTDVLLVTAAVLVLLTSALFVKHLRHTAARIAVLAMALALTVLSGLAPTLDYARLLASVGYRYDTDVQAGRSPHFLFLKEGKAGVISAVTYDGQRVKLQTNGLNESRLSLTDASYGTLSEQLLGLIPYFLHEAPRDAFVVGFGGGTTTRALSYADVQSIDVVELEPAVVEAGHAIGGGAIAVLDDPRVHLQFNDARNTLLMRDTQYDIIVSQPSHPWLAGAANVYTKEFFELAKMRLKPAGIYGQWVNLFNMDASTLGSIMKTFYEVFPHGISFANTAEGDLLLFGSDQPLRFDEQRVAQRLQRPAVAAALGAHDITTSRALLRHFALSRREMLAASVGSTVNSDRNILSEVRLSRLLREARGAENPYDYLAEAASWDLAPYVDSSELTARLYELGRDRLHWDVTRVPPRAAERLRGVDESLARSLEYVALWQIERLHEATAIFESGGQWSQEIVRMQSRVYAVLGRFATARETALHIEDERDRRTTQAYVLFREQDWAALAALQPMSQEEKRLQLLGLAQTDVEGAGAALTAMGRNVDDDIPVLRALVRYNSSRGDEEAMQLYARKLTGAADRHTARLSRLAQTAVKERDAVYLQNLIDQIARLVPEAAELPALQQQLHVLRPDLAGTADPAAARR